MNSHPVKKNWRELFPSRTNSEHWHQSTKPGKHRNTLSQMEFVRRKIERKREGFAPCARRITKECKAMLRNKVEQINLFNSTLLSNKFRDYTCFYCTQKGHVAKSCPTKLSDERLYAQAGAITFRHGDEATRARIRKNKESVKCFKCQGSGHFANTCPQDDTKTTQKQEKETTAAAPSLPEPKVSVKYPEFIHFRTRGIIDGTDKGSWDDFWYISNASNKHMTANLKFFSNLKEEFLVEKLEKQGKFLFTYGIGEVLIENGEGTYMIPGVHYAPEVTLNILSIGLLRQQGFEISSNGDRCTLAYMFKDKRGKDINLDRMREQHNNYLEDYFDVLDRSANIERRIEQPYEKENDDVEIGYGDEGIRLFDGYHGDGNKDGSTAVKEKGIVKHFGITLEEEEGKYDTTAQQDEEDMARIKCYISQRMGHFDFECPSKDQRPTDRASTPRQQGEKDTHSSSGNDFTIIV
ncbi:ARID DNA-binding domain-containing protein [Tanacetum coccineum]